MQMEPQVSFDPGVCIHPENVSDKDGDSGIITSIKNRASKKPAKKPTRQWAAWTREEEERFFTALRQVGKNFDRITRQVQSKNKDQVRHYYYRLVRRMNKLLVPELHLDAKNSKHTNAAMLRWWSLLEKYSCKASKLHLKPRRFKIFMEALELQLSKDRKKRARRRPSQGENCPPTPSLTASDQDKTSGDDSLDKLVLADSQNTQKLSSRKGSSFKRIAKTGVEHNNCKGDSAHMKAKRQQRRPGSASKAAYKRWEKAAIAGVSLVADAAEHLERTSIDKLVDHVEGVNSEKDINPVAKGISTLPSFQQSLFAENNVQPLLKLKLQLFPIDESTRRALEMDNHNPHLELTLSTRKRISSVLDHLSRKWGSSSIASGKLTLLPYCVQKDNIINCQKWTQDSILSAADVYSVIGSPPVFRLRYGWLSSAVCGSTSFQPPVASCMERTINMNDTGVDKVDTIELSRLPGQNLVHVPVPTVPASYDSEEPLNHSEGPLVSAEEIAVPVGSFSFSEKAVECSDIGTKHNTFESSKLASGMTWQRRETSNGTIGRQVGKMDNIHKGTAFSALEWADSLTNMSVGDLLSEMSHNVDVCSTEPPVPGHSECLQQIPFSCDSFDAAIAAHINRHPNVTVQPVLASSIWDAEETCDAFSFRRDAVQHGKVATSPQTGKQTATSLVASASTVELPEAEEPMDDHPAQGDPMNECRADEHPEDCSARDLNGLTDIYWPDSLGPLDLDVPSCRYQSADLILSDSLGGLNRLISNSLDTFQNFSLFGLDK